ncbi:Cell cycle serine/threonine-protein kinase hsk1 [Hypsizygus marmoreus]|uniref:non-specific serine/threonine protein kinase n=1 Tax=Hypsizygus marmoreus TaxID=39966 RepID=A0A369JFF7_HYPMA|nr:Cell cycle serine/threonine-protein kinase hsk1 [Hypsizygus marmoreus]
MATLFLSQHSSNPLEVGSSDPRNSQYRRSLLAAQSRRAEHSLSSDDPIHGYDVESMKRYHRHLAHVLPTFSATNQPQNAYVDLDEGMDSDDELDQLPIVTGPATGHTEDAQDDNDIDDDAHDNESDTPEETDEEMTLYLKSSEERAEIEEEIADLENAVPQLTIDYKIVDRLGTGTFSSVYKAIDLGYHDKWDNTSWQGHHPPSSSAYYQSAPHPRDQKVFVAIKRIYVTSSPERIRNEISIMEDCRGCRHISQLITAFRHDDQVVAIMPYHRNEDFRDFFRTLPIPGIKAYFRCMFRSLRDIHTRGIIHRDVKPANFLFDPRTGIGTLCDFGLASRMEAVGPTYGACLHTSATREHPHGTSKKNAISIEEIKAGQLDARNKSKSAPEKVGYPEKDNRPVSKANRAGTRGFRAPEVLLKCGDQTGAIDVWAAGMILLFFLTGKFPLFQSNDDLEALMEIAMVIGSKNMEKVATLHSRKFSTNVPDLTPEGMPWRVFVEKQNPALYDPPEPDLRYYPYNSPTYHPHTESEHQQRQQQHHDPPPSSSSASSPPPLYFPRSSSPASGPNDAIPAPTRASHRAEIESAFDLLEKLMHPESTKRLTPDRALAHEFLRAGSDGAFDEAADDDEFVPHLFDEGVCREWHFRDEVTDAPCVKVSTPCGCGCGETVEEILTLVSGEGVAIGRQPSFDFLRMFLISKAKFRHCEK